MTTSAEVRDRIRAAMYLDLVGPRPEETARADEILPAPPSQYYLTGFLVPYHADKSQRQDENGDELIDEIDADSGADEGDGPEMASNRQAYFPSSIGLSVLVPMGEDKLRYELSWGDYEPIEADPEADRPGSLRGGTWRRKPREDSGIIFLTDIGDSPKHQPVLGSGGLELVTTSRTIPVGARLAAGTRSVSVFLVNNRPPLSEGQGSEKDRAFAFQPELRLRCLNYFVGRPDPRGAESGDEDANIADLHYHKILEYSVGHNVATVAISDGKNCGQVRTEWMPMARVEKVKAADIEGVDLSMEGLAACQNGAEVRQRVGPLLGEYAAWIGRQETVNVGRREGVKRDLCNAARNIHDRIEAGLACLEDETVFKAFRLANRAIVRAMRRRIAAERGCGPEQLDPPSWRPFQLAFILTNLTGLVDPKHRDRSTVDLLFFPTGGGKTEAYLGLAAFTLVLRRLRGDDQTSAGVSVLMRYTMRLLTLDQLGRAAAVICALELDREAEGLGGRPFEIGLWVGTSATPNRMGTKKKDFTESARAKTLAFQKHPNWKPSPIPLENCPWCDARFNSKSFQLMPNPSEPTDLVVSCSNDQCDFFSRRRSLPILTVDEPIYRRLPCFIIATVDKFAALPWVGQVAALFGKVDHYDNDGFYISSLDKKKGRPLAGPLPPPDLVIQDELHLISGPLGTMTGLYESAIDVLCERDGVRPKIVASTATVRHARGQIRALFGRDEVAIFPPPGPDVRDSFFAVTKSVEEAEPRTYLGVAAPGRSFKVILLRTYLALAAAARRQWDLAGGARNKQNPADPYMTLLGFFNSLRELGGSRRIVEDEIRSRLGDYADRRQRPGETESLLANRGRFGGPSELTSRISTNKISDTKRRLALDFHNEERLDVVLATSMISVGLDITRLGLMVVLGQPKTAAEYIQTTSRVGRDETKPGLVVTLLNVARPRDRSHYERFTRWHQSFYRAVEATSVTPFSPRAVDRGLAGVVVGLARLGHPAMTQPTGAYRIGHFSEELAFVAEQISRRAERHDKNLDAEESEALRRKILARVQDLMETWKRLADPASGRQNLQYQSEIPGPPPLLRNPLDAQLHKIRPEERKFVAYWSLRDVEPVVNLWVRTPDGYDEREE